MLDRIPGFTHYSQTRRTNRGLPRHAYALPNAPGQARACRVARGTFTPGRSQVGSGDWRAGLGRSLCSLLPRPFGCEVSQYLDHATFPAPASSNAACGFPALRSPVRFAPRFMGPITLARLSAVAYEPDS